MTKLLKISALALALQPLATLAAPVTLQSTWSNLSGTYSGIGVFTVSFDDAALPIESPIPTAPFSLANYANVIAAATFAFDNIVLTLDQSQNTNISVQMSKGSGTDAVIRATLLDADNVKYDLYMPFEDNTRAFTDVSLSNLNGLFASEGVAILRPTGAATTGRYYLFQESALTPVPVPAATWLFGSSMLGLAGLARRKKA